MGTETNGSERSGIFWLWRAPNDSLRTGERDELEAALESGTLTPHCFVWRSDWAGWLQAAEIERFRHAIPSSQQMPIVSPAIVEPAGEPPPLPALFDVLSEAHAAPNEKIERPRPPAPRRDDETTATEVEIPRRRPVEEITQTEVEIAPLSLKSDDDEITVPGYLAMQGEEPTCQMFDPDFNPGRASEPPDRVLEHSFRSLAEKFPPLPDNWHERLVRGSIFLACAVALSSLAAFSAVALNRALDGTGPSLVVTVAGPSQTRVPDASVFIDGEFSCVQAPCRVELRPGIHLVSVAAPGFAPAAARAVELERDQVVHFDLVQTSERVAVVAPSLQEP